MIVQKGFKYKLYPTEEQKAILLQQGGNVRFLWNYLLKDNIEYYKQTKKFKFFYEMVMSLPKVKEEYEFLKLSFSQSLQTVTKRLDRALRDSFKGGKGFPNFKKKKDNDSFTFPQGWKLKRSSVFIPKAGEVRWIKHRPLQGKPKHIIISQDGERWYCSVTCEVKVQEKEKKIDNLVGVGLGLKVFATLSDRVVISNPRHLKKDGVVVEDLNISGMMRNHHLAKSIADASWSKFIKQLEYKAFWDSKYFIKIGRFEPTSKSCSRCGWKNEELTLSDRVFNCKVCGLILDRDLNAAINIHRLGASQINACGDEGLLSSLKQEKECLENQAEANVL